jgi:DNA-binding NarL/FixJ family response regulator
MKDKQFNFSSTQLEVLRLLADGLTVREVADKLCRAESSIQARLASLRVANLANTNAQLIAKAFRAGVLT